MDTLKGCASELGVLWRRIRRNTSHLACRFDRTVTVLPTRSARAACVQYSAEMVLRRRISAAPWATLRLCGLLLLSLAALDQTTLAQDLIATARQLYNERQYDDAITLASQAWEQSRSTGTALVVARARLERFRLQGDRADLDAARRLLRTIDPRELSLTERGEWELGVAASLYLHGDYGPAAEILDRLLREGSITGPDRERLVDWWASAVDHAGHHLDLEQRTRTYERLARRLEAELGRNATSAAATYWLVEAVRGTGDLVRAWNLNIAGWVRAGAGDMALRDDLDRLMLQGIIPDLSVSRTALPVDTPDSIAVMATLAREWEVIKERWESE